MKHRLLLAACAGLSFALSNQPLSGQTFLLQAPPAEKTQVGLRFMRPNFDGDAGLATLAGTYDLYVNMPVGAKLNLVGSLPFSSFEADGANGESTIGDIYLGLQAHQGPSNFSFGAFLPTTSENKFSASFLGLLTNYYELQRSLPNTLTLYGNYAYRHHGAEGAMFGLELGPQVFIPTKSDGGDVEVFAHYGLTGGFHFSHAALFAELLGVAILSEDVGDFGDRFIHAFTFGAQLTNYAVRPGIFYQIYLDKDINEALDGVLGIKIEFSLK